MKKVLLALAGFALIGAGCSGSATTDTTATGTTPSTTTPIIGGTETVNTQGGASAGANANVNTPGTSTSVNTGVTAVVKVSMAATNFAFAPATITAKVGQPVEVTFSDVAGFHNFTIDGVTSVAISNGTTVKFNAPSAPGRYPYYCNVGSHRAMGMEGTLIVQ